jgi:hypothetical protein
MAKLNRLIQGWPWPGFSEKVETVSLAFYAWTMPSRQGSRFIEEK